MDKKVSKKYCDLVPNSIPGKHLADLVTQVLHHRLYIVDAKLIHVHDRTHKGNEPQEGAVVQVHFLPQFRLKHTDKGCHPFIQLLVKLLCSTAPVGLQNRKWKS